MGFLYVDGHVRAYHGQRAISSNAYVARRHLAIPATTDYWVNDRSGDPLLVITGEVDAALTKAMPRLLREVREVVGERRVTSATFALKAGVWFRRARLLIVSPDSRANLSRRQAETPLIALFRFAEPALFFRIWAAASLTCSTFSTSRIIWSTAPPWLRITSAALLNASERRPEITTCQPSLA